MKKGTLLERIYVWTIAFISYGCAFIWVEGKVPQTNNSIPLQWACLAFGAVFGVAGLLLAYSSVTYRRKGR